ncbi:MAG TPA: hypothetical protein VMK12_27555 [Anaeromyxobacteraceae bacterium]|nr:hypothetical protein [Anaeromyxobacteraceae bacterium]
MSTSHGVFSGTLTCCSPASYFWKARGPPPGNSPARRCDNFSEIPRELGDLGLQRIHPLAQLRGLFAYCAGVLARLLMTGVGFH